MCALEESDLKRLAGGGLIGKETIGQFNCAGVLKLNGTTINNLQVNGSLLATDAELGALSVHGEANLRGTRVNQPCHIFGYLRAQDTTFNSPLTLGAHKAVFTACKINSITIQEEMGFKAKQIIELKQGTVVDGTIHFESGKGEIHSYGAKITGAITGGKLIKK